jgi:hypothetical protein
MKVYQITQGNLWCQKLWNDVSKTTLSSISLYRSPPHFPYHPATLVTFTTVHTHPHSRTHTHTHTHLQTSAVATITIFLHKHKCVMRRKIIHNYHNSGQVKVRVTLRPTYESASPSWRQAPIWDPRPNLLSPRDYVLDGYCLLCCSALSDERTGL